jgi:hypothetical protein
VQVEVKPRPNRLARVALRSATVALEPPRRPGYRLPALSVKVGLAREESPPPDAE